MTTPQNELYNLSCHIKKLISLFETEEEKQDIFTNVELLYNTVLLIDKRIDVLQDQMALIIKLLNKTNEP